MFAIVTRNKLRSHRHAASMVWAWWHIRRQLAETPGMLRYTTGIANLREFYTLTLWERELDMYRFMSSDAHAQMMWNFRKWDESFWSMRFNPCEEEIGEWHERRFAGAERDTGTFADAVPDELLSHLPVLQQFRMQPAGCRTLRIDAVIGRVPAPSPLAILRVRRALRSWHDAGAVSRSVVAVGPGECLLVAVPARPQSEQARTMLTRLDERLPEAWGMRFHLTDFEIGHWDQLRLRELADVQ